MKGTPLTFRSRSLNGIILLGLVLISMVSLSHADLGFDPRPFVKPCKLTGPVDDGIFQECAWKVDYIIASGGTAGLSAARVLIDAGYSVLVLEPGEYRNNDPNIQSSFGYDVVNRQLYSTYEAPFRSTVDSVLGKTYDVAIARMFGGSMNHNGEMWVKPSLQWLQELEQIGGSTEWSVSSSQQAFKDIEKYNRAGTIDPLRGTSGKVDVRRPVDGPTSGTGSLAYFIASCTSTASGLPITPDYNGANGWGPFARYDLSQKPNMDRSSTSFAYFPTTFMNPDGTAVNTANKFRVLFHSTVVRVIFVGTRAIGVEYLRNGRTSIAYADEEVALAGSLYSAQILQHSGIGPATLLESKGIDVVYDNPNVGTHVSNHPAVALSFTYDAALTPSTPVSDPWALYGAGSFFPHWDAVGPVNTSELQFPRQFQVMWFGPYFPGDKLNMYIIQLRPKSEGLVQIQSADPLDTPLYKDNFYTVGSDLDDIAHFLFYGVQGTLAPELHSQNSAFNPEWAPWASVNDAKQFVLKNAAFNYHYTAANRMSQSSSTGVVDPRGRVFGVDKLRVLDSSAVPTAVDGNTAAVAAFFGRRIAQKMVEDA